MTKIQFSEIQAGPVIINTGEIQIELPAMPTRYYRHGWQSWSLTAWTEPAHLPIQKPDIFHPLQTDPVYVTEQMPNGSWLGAVEFDDGNVLLLGAVGTDAHVFLHEDQLSGLFEAGDGDWFMAFGSENTVFSEYAKQLEKQFGKSHENNTPRVWCSWYSLYTVIDERILFDTFDQLGDLPFDVLQIDDGWQLSVGDWSPNNKFPSGMHELAIKIRATGRKAGLWLAPLLAVKSSRLFRDHPEWFLRDDRGRYVSAGFNWGEQLYALDTTLPAVTEWLAALMKQVRGWGFDYLKLDFLYAGALKGKRANNMPREAAYRDGLRILREAMGADAFFLTCGTPILPALGLCDAMRIGPDVAHLWEKHRDSVLLYNQTTPATKNAIRTVVHRLWLKSIINVDSDVAYFAERENGLTKEQKKLLQDLALVCNFKATSDMPQWMTNEEREQLRSFLTSKPAVRQVDRYIYQLDGRRIDFSSAISLPEPPKGLISIWAAILGWLGSNQSVLKIIKIMDDAALKKRREGL